MGTLHIPAEWSLDQIETAATGSAIGDTVAFEPGTRTVERTLRLPEGRSYIGYGCILRATAGLIGPVFQVYAIPRPPVSRWQRVVRWLRWHLLHHKEGPFTLVSGFAVIGGNVAMAMPPL